MNNKIIVTSTECYSGNATHGRNHQHQLLMCTRNVEQLPFLYYVNGPSDDGRSFEVIKEFALTDEVMNQLISLKEKFTEIINKLAVPSFDGNIPYRLKSAFEAANVSKAKKKEMEDVLRKAQSIGFELEKHCSAVADELKKQYCNECWSLLKDLVDFDFKYFQSIFY
jgi:hypothetical protein